MDRYRFARHLERRLGFFPIFFSFGDSSTLLFPVGRSDRAYVLVRGPDLLAPRSANEGGDAALLCYQRTGHRDRLVYRVDLGYRPRAPDTKGERVKSLLTFLNTCVFGAAKEKGRDADASYAVRGRVSRAATRDLARERDYVAYHSIPYTDTLVVWSTSDLRRGAAAPESDKQDSYDLDGDPTTGAKLGQDEFYRRFGLPGVKADVPPRIRSR